MAEDASRLRIGDAERTSAMKALDADLEAGRPDVQEYADRSALADEQETTKKRKKKGA